ncbi:MAG: hypothetical protein AB7P23_11465 [Amphiplicatus sp.]
MKLALFLTGAALAAAFLAPAARADGAQTETPTILQLGGSQSPRVSKSPAVSTTTQNGVRILRGAPALLGAAAPAPQPPAAAATRVVVVNHDHSRIRHLRTQGFYSGHPGKSRRFTQGFYSGPVDKGRHADCQ